MPRVDVLFVRATVAETGDLVLVEIGGEHPRLGECGSDDCADGTARARSYAHVLESEAMAHTLLRDAPWGRSHQCIYR